MEITQIHQKIYEIRGQKVMLDRSGSIYHGNIAAFADSAREGGLVF